MPSGTQKHWYNPHVWHILNGKIRQILFRDVNDWKDSSLAQSVSLLFFFIQARILTRLPWIMPIDNRNDVISRITIRGVNMQWKTKVSMNREIRGRAQLWKREKDIKTKLRPFGKEITKSMFPQESNAREGKRDGAVALYQHQQERNITTAAAVILSLSHSSSSCSIIQLTNSWHMYIYQNQATHWSVWVHSMMYH